MSTSALEHAEALEQQKIDALGDRFVHQSWLYRLASGDQSPERRPAGAAVLMGEDPRLPQMPDAPTLMRLITEDLQPQ